MVEVSVLTSWSWVHCNQVTVAGQHRTFTGFAVTTRAIRGSGYLYQKCSLIKVEVYYTSYYEKSKLHRF